MPPIVVSEDAEDVEQPLSRRDVVNDSQHRARHRRLAQRSWWADLIAMVGTVRRPDDECAGIGQAGEWCSSPALREHAAG